MTKLQRAYVAGFLDGDGSVIFQLVRRFDYRLGFQVRASICFYQNSSGIAGLQWIKKQIGVGSIRERTGNMCDLTIVGIQSVETLLEAVRPFVVFKRRQVTMGLELARTLRLGAPSNADALCAAAKMVDDFASLNYSKNRSVTAQVVRDHLSIKRRSSIAPNSEHS